MSWLFSNGYYKPCLIQEAFLAWLSTFLILDSDHISRLITGYHATTVCVCVCTCLHVRDMCVCICASPHAQRPEENVDCPAPSPLPYSPETGSLIEPGLGRWSIKSHQSSCLYPFLRQCWGRRKHVTESSFLCGFWGICSQVLTAAHQVASHLSHLPAPVTFLLYSIFLSCQRGCGPWEQSFEGSSL